MKKIITTIIAFLIIILIAIGIFAGKGKENKNLTKITVAEVAHSIFMHPCMLLMGLDILKKKD